MGMFKVKTTAHRYHDICAGHRVVGHESKCRHLHGHNYRVHFFCEAPKANPAPITIGGEVPSVNAQRGLDDLGRVIDFSVIKERLCMWLEEEWDHKFLYWGNDPLISALIIASNKEVLEPFPEMEDSDHIHFHESLVQLPFNPTAENMAQYLLEVVGPKQLEGTGVTLVKVVIEETAKCAVTCEL